MEETGLFTVETRIHPGLPPLGQNREPRVGVPAPTASVGIRSADAPMALRGRAMRRRTGSHAPGRGQATAQDDVTSRVNQYRIRQAAYELVAFFDTSNVSPTHHKADTWASCEAQLYALRSDPPQLCAYDPEPRGPKGQLISPLMYVPIYSPAVLFLVPYHATSCIIT
eukprot:1839049-Pyramimonas_sp.AAC.1